LIESSVDLARCHSNQPVIKEYSHQICDLAIASQQLNQQAKVNEATALTDMNDFFAMCGRVMLDDQNEGYYTAQAVVEVVKGFLGIARGANTGVVNATRKWGTFVGNVCAGDEVTFEKMGQDLKNIGNVLGVVARELTEAYNSFITMDGLAQDGLTHCKNKQDFLNYWESLHKKDEERIDKITNGAVAILQAGQDALEGMMQRSLEDNIAGITESVIDTIIIGKAVETVGLLAKAVSSQCLQAGQATVEIISTKIFDATSQINNGQVTIVAAGQAIEEAVVVVAAVGEVVTDALIDTTKLAIQGNNLYNNGKESIGGGGSKQPENNGKHVESVKGSPEWTKKYPNGEYRQSAKHNPNSPNGIGKPPCDGQAALNNSFSVEKSRERVTVQDGKIIVLKFEEEGIYHGYIVEDFFSIKNVSTQQALVDNGLVRSMKSGAVIK